MKEIYTMEEMEELLPSKGYHIRDENGKIDDSKVILTADEIGYELVINHIDGEPVFMQKRLAWKRRRERRKKGYKLWWLL